MAIAIGSVSLGGAIASAVPGPGGTDPRIDGETVITMTGTAEGVAVRGNLPTDGSTSDPGSAYPSAPPATHTEVKNTFAGIITADEVGGNASLRLYCIDIHTSTYPGIGYDQGSWDASGMPNLGYVARLLNDYYPNTSEPSGSPNDNVKAAAVQAAIWYFTDNFVLAVDSPILAQTADIVNTVRTQSPLPAPAPPALALAPDSITAALGTAAGPFALVTDAVGGATIAVSGGLMYRDAARQFHCPAVRSCSTGRNSGRYPSLRPLVPQSRWRPRANRPCRPETCSSTTGILQGSAMRRDSSSRKVSRFSPKPKRPRCSRQPPRAHSRSPRSSSETASALRGQPNCG